MTRAGRALTARPDAGQLFAAYQADAATAFVPVQARLAETDVMNPWITHVGSAAFVVPPGCDVERAPWAVLAPTGVRAHRKAPGSSGQHPWALAAAGDAIPQAVR
jgi:hypothetical protein